ncbi:hypothetical protein MTR_4g066250 [Medicago truncatula]|uniref:Uncharacterized protein n=1 Tax=Medicago truncatula TaxID=3880 RepID=A0A072UKK3_MEDTR|nr:hypothetical protein MTR_4g066250 [Medicago truncatula]
MDTEVELSHGCHDYKNRRNGKAIINSHTQVEVPGFYSTITNGCKEIPWMKKFMQESGLNQQSYVPYCDSQSAIHLRNNSTYNQGQTHRCESLLQWSSRGSTNPVVFPYSH